MPNRIIDQVAKAYFYHVNMHTLYNAKYEEVNESTREWTRGIARAAIHALAEALPDNSFRMKVLFDMLTTAISQDVRVEILCQFLKGLDDDE